MNDMVHSRKRIWGVRGDRIDGQLSHIFYSIYNTNMWYNVLVDKIVYDMLKHMEEYGDIKISVSSRGIETHTVVDVNIFICSGFDKNAALKMAEELEKVMML